MGLEFDAERQEASVRWRTASGLALAGVAAAAAMVVAGAPLPGTAGGAGTGGPDDVVIVVEQGGPAPAGAVGVTTWDCPADSPADL